MREFRRANHRSAKIRFDPARITLLSSDRVVALRP
jgi:hypothetical protein